MSQPTFRCFRPEELLRMPSVLETFRASLDFRSFDVSPEGARAVFSWNRSGTYELYEVTLADGELHQLTLDHPPGHRAMQPRYSPSGERIAFLRDHDGDERFDIVLLDRGAAGERCLTEVPANREALEWSSDRSLVYRSHEGGGLGIWTIDVEAGSARVLVASVRDPGADHITPDPSGDGRFIAYHHVADDDPTNVVISVATVAGDAEPWTIETHPGERARAIFPRWGPGDEWLAFTTDRSGRFEVALVPMADGRPTGGIDHLPTSSPADEVAMGWTPGGALLYRRSVDSAVSIRRYDPMDRSDVEVVESGGVCYDIRETVDGAVAYIWTSPVSPADVYVKPPVGGPRRLTQSLSADIDERDLVAPEHVWYPGADDIPIPALLYRPPSGAKEPDGAPPPAIVWAHGGGSWQHLMVWDPLPQWFTNRGYLVLAPNARGSRGYGRSFREANRGDFGGKDVDDHVRGADWLEHEGLADGGRIGVYGSSGGGFLVAASLTRAPDRWAAGVTVRGLVSLDTFLRSTRDDMRGGMQSYLGSPDKDPDQFRARSPLDLVDRIRAPLLILHGKTDPRVPVSEAELFADALRRHGATYDLHIYPDEGHGFQNMDNRCDALVRTLNWFDEHLGRRGP